MIRVENGEAMENIENMRVRVWLARTHTHTHIGTLFV